MNFSVNFLLFFILLFALLLLIEILLIITKYQSLLVILHCLKISLILKMNIPYIVEANPENTPIFELLKEIYLIIKLDKGITVIHCKDILNC